MKSKILFLVAPGMGKTHLSEADSRFLDFDIGVLKKHMVGMNDSIDVRWKKTKELYPSFFEALNISFKWFDFIMINEPAFAEYCVMRKMKVEVITVAPSLAVDWINRICTRDLESPFCADIRIHAEEWLPGWSEIGEKLGRVIKLTEGQYLSDIVNKEFKSTK